MGSWSAFLFAYLLGGVTFIPLVIAAILLHSYQTLPIRDGPSDAGRDPRDDIVQPGDDVSALKDAQDKKDEAKSRLASEPEVAAGYFAVCREYTPMGINAKPIERSTPVGSATVTAPSPSVYQTMYRSIFERKQTSSPLNDKGAANQRPKMAGNVFYVALRHGHLMLFDDDEQLEVRHVVSLAHHDVSIYSGGDPTPEGELYIKKNAICLSRRRDQSGITPDTQISKPFYLFSENCSAKEDFYFALLRSQEHTLDSDRQIPEPLRYDVQDIISLVQKLHASEDNMNTRWLNAVIGRVFLSLYKTRELENIIREKLTKKISRVKRPSFLSHIVIRHIHTGNAAPYISNPRLKDLNVDGECVVEADIRYTGNFRIEVATTAKIDLGSRFKVREVDLVLAVMLKRIEGRGLFKIKAPPSNRFWFAFQSMPKLEMSIEPIVSSRQITYTMILRQIENRIKEVVAESIVLPFWDDTPFFDTQGKSWRGGIWTADHEKTTPPNVEVIDAPEVEAAEASDRRNALDMHHPPESPTIEKSYTDPLAAKSHNITGIFSRNKSVKSLGSNLKATTTGSDASLTPSSASWPSPSRSSADVAVSQGSAQGEPVSGLKETPASALATLSAVAGTSPPKSSTPLASPLKPPPPVARGSGAPSFASSSYDEHESKTGGESTTSTHDRRSATSSTESVDTTASSGGHGKAASLKSQAGSISRGLFRREETSGSVGSTSTAASSNGNIKNTTLTAVGNAALQAKQWGLNAFQRHRDKSEQQSHSAENHPNHNQNHHHFNSRGVDLTQPMGRGRPLPPPGTPLPPPERHPRKSSVSIPPKRKNVPPPLLPERKPVPSPAHSPAPAPEPVPERQPEERKEVQAKRPVPPPPLPRRRVRDGTTDTNNEPVEQHVFVVEAPHDSQPASPASWGGEAASAADGEARTTAPEKQEARSLKGKGNQAAAAGGASPLAGGGLTADDLSSINTPITAVPVEREEEEDDDGYSGWMEDVQFDDEPLAGAATELAAAANTA